MDTNNEMTNKGHNNGPSLGTTERIEGLLDATLNAVLKRVQSDDCNGTDLGAAIKVLKEVGALQAIATNREHLEAQLHQQQMIGELPKLDDFDEQGRIVELPANRPSR